MVSCNMFKMHRSQPGWSAGFVFLQFLNHLNHFFGFDFFEGLLDLGLIGFSSINWFAARILLFK